MKDEEEDYCVHEEIKHVRPVNFNLHYYSADFTKSIFISYSDG